MTENFNRLSSEEQLIRELDATSIRPYDLMGLDAEEAEELCERGTSVMERWRLILEVLTDREERKKLFHTAENMLYFAEDTDKNFEYADALIGTASELGWVYSVTKVTKRTMKSELTDYVDSDGVFSVGDFEYAPRDWKWTDEGFQHIEEEYDGPRFEIYDQVEGKLKNLQERLQKVPAVGNPKNIPHYLWGMILVLAITALCTFQPAISSFLFGQREPAEWLMVITVLISFVVLFTYGYVGCFITLFGLGAIVYFGVLRRIVFLLIAGVLVIFLFSSYLDEKKLLKNKNSGEDRRRYLLSIEQDAQRIFDFSNRVAENMKRMREEEWRDLSAHSPEEQYRRRKLTWYIEEYIEHVVSNRTSAQKILNEVREKQDSV